MRQASEAATNAKRAKARQPANPKTLQEIEAERRLLIQNQQEEERVATIEAERRYLDRDGNVLHYWINFPKTKEKKSAVTGNVNEHKFAIPRGMDAKVPWFIVMSFANNKEATYAPASVDGRLQAVETETLAEHFTARPINPGDEVPY